MGILSRTFLAAVLIVSSAGAFPIARAESLADVLADPPDPAGASPGERSHKLHTRTGFRIHQQRLYIAVTDDNGKAVPAAAVLLYSPAARALLRAETDFAGR